MNSEDLCCRAVPCMPDPYQSRHLVMIARTSSLALDPWQLIGKEFGLEDTATFIAHPHRRRVRSPDTTHGSYTISEPHEPGGFDGDRSIWSRVRRIVEQDRREPYKEQTTVC